MNQLPRRLRPEPLPEVTARLAPLREGFLNLHKALLDGERAAYEKERGAIPNNMEFLKLVMEDEYFAWLRPFSQFIIQIDEGLETDPALTLAGAEALVATARRLLASSETGTAAELRYFNALQRSDDAVFHHADLRRHLNTVR